MLSKADSFRKEKNIELSIQTYRNVFYNNPKFVVALNQLAHKYECQKNLKKAIQIYKKVLDIEQDNKTACQELGKFLQNAYSLNLPEKEIQEINWQDTIETFIKTLEFQPKIAAEAIGIDGVKEEDLYRKFYMYLATFLFRVYEDIQLSRKYVDRAYKNHIEQKQEQKYEKIWKILNSINILIDTSKVFSENEFNTTQVEQFFDSKTTNPKFIHLFKMNVNQQKLLTEYNLLIEVLQENISVPARGGNQYRGSFNLIDEINQNGKNVINFGCVYVLCPFTGKLVSSKVSFPIGDAIFYYFVSYEVFYFILYRGAPLQPKFLYFPNYNLVLSGQRGQAAFKDLTVKLKQLKTYMVANWEVVTSYIKNRKKSLLAITGTFPHLGHALLNELSAYQNLHDCNLLANIHKFLIGNSDKWDFQQIFPEISNSKFLKANIQNDVDIFRQVIKDNYFVFKPLQPFTIQQKLADRINSSSFRNSSKETLKKVEEAKKFFPLVCFEIRSKNRRVWVSQIESIVNIIKKLHKDYPDIGVVLAGWTCIKNQNIDRDLKNIEGDKEIVNRIVSRMPTISIYSVVGCTVQEMIVWANSIDLYVYGFGTGIDFYGIAKKPGVIHSNRSLHGWAQEHFTQFVENAIIPEEIPIDCIYDRNPQEKAFTRNYDINWEILYQKIAKIITNLPEERKAFRYNNEGNFNNVNNFNRRQYMPNHSSRRINLMAQQNSASNYLEIGTAAGKTFLTVNIETKVAVDPNFQFNWKDMETKNILFYEMKSDIFFENLNQNWSFDIIFIDGLHTFEQTLRDFINSIGCSHRDTIWLIDDTVPMDVYSAWPDQKEAAYFRKQAAGGKKVKPGWHGDVYKVIFALHDFFPLFSYCTIQTGGNPQTVVWYQQRKGFKPRFNSLEAISRIDYFTFLKNKDLLKCQNEEACFDTIRNLFNKQTNTISEKK